MIQRVRLRILRGHLQQANGAAEPAEAIVDRRQFAIGTARGCHMRCRSDLISATHCILENDGRNVAVQDLDTPAGTFVNGRRVARSAPLNDGDLLRVGRLEFEVLIDRDGCEKDATAPSATPPATVDSLAEFVTTMFAEADAREREKRAADAGLREIRIRRVSSPKAQVADAPEAPSRPAPVRKRPSGPPGKLPHPPSICAKTTTTAAELALREMFEHRRWRRGIRWW